MLNKTQKYHHRQTNKDDSEYIETVPCDLSMLEQEITKQTKQGPERVIMCDFILKHIISNKRC